MPAQGALQGELQDRLWPGTFVVEKNLTNLMSEIREALGDDPAHPRFIRTVHRFGYAFRARRVDAEHGDPDVGPRHNLPAPLTNLSDAIGKSLSSCPRPRPRAC